MDIIRFVPIFDDPDRIVHAFGRRSLRKPFSVERLYLPYVFFRYRVEWTNLLGRPGGAEGLFLADLLQGAPVHVERATAFALAGDIKNEFSDFIHLMEPDRSKRTIAVDRLRDPADDVLPAALSEEDAVERARSVLKYDVMRVMGGLRFRKMAVRPLPGGRRLYYPFWLVYYKDRKGRMDFAAFDGLTGRRERGQVARSIKLGLMNMEAR